MNRAIGGFFELELEEGNEFYEEFYNFNFSRHAISYYFESIGIKTIWLPSYICGSVIHSLRNSSFSLKFYNIKDLVNPIFPEYKDDEGLLLINYFGISNLEGLPIKLKQSRNVLVDNCHGFFNDLKLFSNVVFSPRKYFGIPDGAYLKTKNSLFDFNSLPFFKTDNFIKHLISRIENGPEDSYQFFREYQQNVKFTKVNKMSKFTQRILSSIDYNSLKSKRSKNFLFFSDNLKEINKIQICKPLSPLCYPLLLDNGADLREELIRRKVYIPQYWPEVLININADEYDLHITKNLVCLPIDQRYGLPEMSEVLQIINQWRLG